MELLRLPFDVAREIYCGIGVGVETCWPRRRFPYERFQAVHVEPPLTADELVAVRQLIESSSVPVSTAPGAAEHPAGAGPLPPTPAGPPGLLADDLLDAASALRRRAKDALCPEAWHALANKFEWAAEQLRAQR
jgi:hypothetical protein